MSWSPKKWVLGPGWWIKHNLDVNVPQGVYFLEELFESVAFGQKLWYFTDQNGPKERPHENESWLFSNSEMNITNSCSRKSRCEKLGHFFSFHTPFLSYGPYIVFLQFCAGLSKKSKFIKSVY